jgi:hypothetical protein
VSPQAGGVSREEARAAIDDVLARPEFRPESDGLGGWIRDRIGDAIDWLGDLFGFDGDLSAFPLQAMLYLLLALSAALVPSLDRKSFGGEPAGPEDVARLAALCERWLGKAA